ncbi:hypothetical protein [Neobacillus drentensis]|uniref:hypothetical protein n=1 Tax=Neobacillus drentensis TaxID=220684 RepID=UPI0030004210
MGNLDFLEISRNFKSYYQTLRDVHYYLTNDSEVKQEELEAVSKLLSKLIYGFIRIKGISFREMDRDQFEQEFNLFHQDFLNIIQKSGENNVEFDQFTALIDEIIGIAVKRTIALGKIKKVKQELLLEEEEIAEVEDSESELSYEDEDNVTEDEVVDDFIGGMDEIKAAVSEVETLSTEVRYFSTDAVTLSNEVRPFSTDVATLNNEIEVIFYEIENAEDNQLELGNEVVVADVVNQVNEVNEVNQVNIVKAAVVPPKKVKNNYVDAAPVVNNLNDNESSGNFRFRPRRRKQR